MGQKILIVDDNFDNLRLASRVVRHGSYEVEEASNALEATRKAKKLVTAGQLLCILMDINMYKVDGLDVTRTLRKDPAFEDVVIIAVSANTQTDTILAAYKAGVDAYVTKPIAVNFFTHQIKLHLSNGRRHVEYCAACNAPVEVFYKIVKNASGESELVSRRLKVEDNYFDLTTENSIMCPVCHQPLRLTEKIQQEDEQGK